MNEKKIIPAIVAVGYDRPDSMCRLLKSVCNADYPCDEITLIVSIDESKKSDEVQKVAEKFEWKYGKKIIRRFPKRMGLRNHILACGDLSYKYGAVIILEDDLIVSPSFFHYTVAALNHFKNDEKIAGIALYSHAWNGYANYQFIPEKKPYDTYLGCFSITWGQCWSSENWTNFKEWYTVNEDNPNLIDDNLPIQISQWGGQSWGKYFAAFIVEKQLYYVIPYIAMSTNFSEKGQHNFKIDSAHQVSIMEGIKKEYMFPEYSKAVKYDMFFERELNDTKVCGIDSEYICINLNGKRQTSGQKEYVLTTQKLNYEIIGTFGLQMRPIEANVLHCVDGNDIFLYKCGKNAKFNTALYELSRGMYETYDLSLRTLYPVCRQLFNTAVNNRIKRIKSQVSRKK